MFNRKDLVGFGRREMKITPEEGYAITKYQCGALQAFLDAEGMSMHHVKPHGVFYGMMMRDYDLCLSVCRALPPGVPLFGHAGTFMEQACKELDIPFIAEACVDISYSNGGIPVIKRRLG